MQWKDFFYFKCKLERECIEIEISVWNEIYKKNFAWNFKNNQMVDEIGDVNGSGGGCSVGDNEDESDVSV